MALNDAYDARPVRWETALGAGAQIPLLALLDAAHGMGPAGRLTGLVFAGATWAALTRALHRTRPAVLGPANRVTLGRAGLVGAVTALVADSFRAAPPVPLLVGLTAVALLLDGVDGLVARRTGTSTPLGARFDMEVDAFLILVLSVYVSVRLGPWVLLIGAMRYVFVAAARVRPWLSAPLPPSGARKTVAALQGVLLLTAGAELLPLPVDTGLVLTALGLLVWSFGRDVRWLRRTSRAGTARVAVAVPGPRLPGTAARAVPEPHHPGTGHAAVLKPHHPGTGHAPVPEPHHPGTAHAPVPEPHHPVTAHAPIPEPHHPGTAHAPVPDPHHPVTAQAAVPEPLAR